MTNLKTGAETRPYHHGDLQRAIIDAALDVLAESQSTDFSLRELARRAGVSHNAPYKHFADKRDLLAAVSAAGFERLATEMARAQEEFAYPRDRLAAAMRAHVRSGVENPALYRLMFGASLAGQDNNRPAVEVNAAQAVKTLLVDAIKAGAFGRCLVETAPNDRHIDSVLLVLWAQMHGLTLLLIDRLVGPSTKAGELADCTLQALIDGLDTGRFTVSADVWIGPSGGSSI